MLTFSQAKRVWRGLRSPFFSISHWACRVRRLPHGQRDVVDGLVDAAVDDLFLEGSEEAFGHAVGFGLANEGEARSTCAEFDLVWKWSAMNALPWSWRSARPRAIRPRQRQLGFDRHADSLGRGVAITNLGNVRPYGFGVPVVDDGKQPDLAIQHGRDLRASVPHIRFGASVMMRPSWAASWRGRWRCGDSRPFSRINRSTRLRATRMPSSTRSRAQTLRCPSPIQGDRSRSARMALITAASESPAGDLGVTVSVADRYAVVAAAKR